MLGYLINQYPAASQTFIRREIAAIEASGTPVRRYAVRGWSGTLVDPDDQAEPGRTARILDAGAAGLLFATLAAALTAPLAFGRALATAWRLGGRSQRGRLVHFAYLWEACVLRRWCARDGVDPPIEETRSLQSRKRVARRICERHALKHLWIAERRITIANDREPTLCLVKQEGGSELEVGPKSLKRNTCREDLHVARGLEGSIAVLVEDDCSVLAADDRAG